MDWNDFLAEMSDRLRLTSEQREVLMARLADENRGKSEAKVATDLNISVATLKKHMNAIYALAGDEFPSVAQIKGRGKLKELRACLKNDWQQKADLLSSAHARKPTPEETDEPDDTTTAHWQKICRDMLVEREQLTSNRLMMSPDMHKTLDLFVDLALVQQNKADKRDGDVLPEYGSQLYEPSRYSEAERFEFKRFLEEVLSVQKNEKLTIVGEPGCGKTTLLQKVAFWLLDNTKDLVIWVSLAELKDKPLRDYLTEDWLQDAFVKADSAVMEDWGQQFLNRRVWLLLDGLDEMTPETRDALSLKGWVSQARVVVTCRLNVWQTNPRLINGFETYRMLEFRLVQIKEFIRKWFSQDEAIGQNLQNALNQPGKERIRDLARNPLRLTLLCSNWHLREGKLPGTRAELYKQFVDDLYEWKRESFPTTTQQRKELNEKLGELAKEAIDKEVTRFRLRHDLVCEILGEATDSESMLGLALDLGWINAIGVDPKNPRKPVYSFFHATFQEYFAARDIYDWDFFVPSNHENKPIEHSDIPGKTKPYRIFEPQWKEVILLWLGREDIPDKEKIDFLNLLIKFNDGCRGFYFYQSFFLATLGILEFPRHPDFKEVIQETIHYGFGGFKGKSRKWLRYFKPIEKKARIAIVTSNNSITIENLINLCQEVENIFVRYEIADLVGRMDFDNPISQSILMETLEDSESDWAKLDISKSLVQNYSNGCHKAEKTLVELARGGSDIWIRREAAWTLIKNTSHQAAGIDSLIDIFCKSKDEFSLFDLKLHDLGLDSPKLLRTLFRMSFSGDNQYIRAKSTECLAQIIAQDKRAIDRIIKILKTFNFINPLKSKDISGIDILYSVAKWADESRCLESRENRRKSFFKLVEFAISQPDVTMLIAKLGTISEGGETRKKIASELFRKIDVDFSLIIPTWKVLVENLQDRRLRSFLVLKMTDAGFDDERIKSVVSQVLDETDINDENMRRWLAEGLREYDSTNTKAINVFFDLLQRSERYDTCRWVSGDLGEACNDNDSVIESFVDLLVETTEKRIVYGITSGLKNVFKPYTLKIIATRLKRYLSEDYHDKNYSLYQGVFEILWHCASRLSYAEFYTIWHSESNNLLSD